MKRSAILLAAVVVLSVWIAGCNSGPPQKEIKDAFIHQLIRFCAEVNRQVAEIPGGKEAEPGMAADQFALFAKQARDYQPKPDIDRDKFEIMVTEFDNTAGHFRAAQDALTAGDRPTADAALAQAERQVARTNAAAQEYGMPPIDTCADHESGTPAPGTSAAPAPGTAVAPAPGTSAAPAPAAGWWPRQEMPVAVQQINATELNGRIWTAGGLDSHSKATATTQFYDPVINSWELGPPLPEPMHHAMLVNYHDQLAVIGGFRSSDTDPLAVTSPRMLLLDINTDKWVDGPPLRHPRAGGGAAVCDNKIVVMGGRVGNPAELVTQTEVYDGTAWRAAADIPTPGDHLAVTADSRYCYAVGGRKFSAGSNTDVVQRYDPKADRWTALPRTPQTVSGAGAGIVDGRLVIVGRETPTSVSGAVHAYDLTAPNNATWITLAPLTPPPGRHGLGVTAIGNTLYAVGGATKAGHTGSTNLVAALTVPARRVHAAAAWWPRQEMPVAVQQINATELNGRIWTAGGLDSHSKATATTQFYDPVINSWELGPPLPEPMHHAMLVNYHDQLAVIGGFRSSDTDPLAVTSPRMLLLDINTDKWVDGPPLRHPRAGGGAAVCDNKIVVMGGRVGNPAELVTQTEVYDGTAWRAAADIPTPGDHLAVTADSRYCYAVGGRKFSAGSNTDVVQRYDPKADRWTILPRTPQTVSGAGAGIVDGRLVIVGRETPTSVSGAVHAYDLTAPNNATWITLAPLTPPPGRHGLGVTAIGNTLYAVGGATKAGHTGSTNLVAALRFS